MCRFIKKLISNECKYPDDENYKQYGRAYYRKTSLLALIVFAHYDDGIDNCRKISEYAQYNYTKYVCDDIQPSERILQRFIKNRILKK